MSEPQQTITVWDIPTRIFHWLIVALFLFQWFSMEFMDDWMEYHELAGYAFLTLLLFRLVWGFIGPEYVRFSHFLHSPRIILNYSKSIFDRNAAPHAGHNPLGGLSVLVLLLLLLVQAISGLFMTDDILFYGPYYNSVSDETQKLMSRLHHMSFDMLVWLIALHIVAVLFYVFFKKQSIVAAMIHGRKNVGDGNSIGGSKLLVAVIVLLVCCGFVYGLVDYFAPETIDYF